MLGKLKLKDSRLSTIPVFSDQPSAAPYLAAIGIADNAVVSSLLFHLDLRSQKSVVRGQGSVFSLLLDTHYDCVARRSRLHDPCLQHSDLRARGPVIVSAEFISRHTLAKIETCADKLAHFYCILVKVHHLLRGNLLLPHQ